MIIDFKADCSTAMRHRVLCARTGEDLSGWPIFYADDVEGVVKCYVQDEDGSFRVNAARTGVETETIRKAIKIVPKSPGELAEIDEFERQFPEDAEVFKVLADTVLELRVESWCDAP